MLQYFRRYGTLTCFMLLLLGFWLLLPDTFMTGRNIFNVTQQMSMLAVVAFAMTIVMAMGDFDLSVGSMASLAGIVAAVVFRETGLVPLGIGLALLAGLIGGVLNGFLVSYVGILPFVATLGTLTVFSGAAFLASGGKTIFGADIPEAFGVFARGGIPLWQSGEITVILPNLTIIAVLTLAIVWFVLEKMVFGRHLYAMGGNAEAARLAGIPVKRLRLMAYAAAGLGAALAGLMYASRVASANPTQGSGLMLDAIAAVFLGMTISRNGEPRVLNTLIGVLLLGVLSNGLTQLSVDSYVRDIIVGVIIIAAVAASSLDKINRN
ncbi:MAG: ABC transporter permease [Rhizobiales bacterium]|nr:ABC transporter permease [Hyphomicrobiales bacterium]